MTNPALPRMSSEEERRQIKVRTKQLIQLAGGVEFFAPVTGVNKAALSKYGSVSEPDSFIRADVMLELDRQIGAPMMVETLAAMLGYRLMPLETTPDAALGVPDLLDVQRETVDVVQELGRALTDDGVVDIHECRTVRQQIAEAKASLHRLDRKLAGGAA